MNKSTFKTEITAILGSTNTIAEDSQGVRTVGVAHIITGNDTEATAATGSTITDERVDALFTIDYDNTVQFCIDQYTSFTTKPETVQHSIMKLVAMFNYYMVYSLSGFASAINDARYSDAADIIEAADWQNKYSTEIATIVSDLRGV